MKTLTDVKKLLDTFGERYNYSVADAQQGSEAWFHLKLGVLSASNASKIVAKKGTATRDGYMAELVAQVCTGIMPELNGMAALEWGKDHEDAARSAYEFFHGVKTVQVPFVYLDDSFRVGVSPDFLVDGQSKGGEIKCPFNSKNYIEFLCAGKIKPEWDWQCQFTLFVLGADEWDFSQYDPRMKKNSIKTVTVKPDLKKQDKLAEAIPEFISDMDKMLEKAGFKFGEQWQGLSKQRGVA